MIKENSSITRDELSKKVNISTATIGRSLKELQEIGIIERVGSNKTGYWKIIK